MGIIAWIVLGLGAGLLANMLIPGRRSQGLILTCVIGVAGALAGGWVATRLFHVHTLQRVLQPVHLAHRHRRRSRPAARLPSDQRPVRRFPPVRAPLSTVSKVLPQTAWTCRSAQPRRIRATRNRRGGGRRGLPAPVSNSDPRSTS